MMKKKAQGLSINAVILIVLGIIVLVILALGFTIGWDKFAFWIPSNNVDTIVKACDSACAAQSTYDYCSVKRELKTKEFRAKDVSCYALSYGDVFSDYDIARCSGLDCSNVNCTNFTYVKLPAKKTDVPLNVTVDGKNITTHPTDFAYCKK